MSEIRPTGQLDVRGAFEADEDLLKVLSTISGFGADSVCKALAQLTRAFDPADPDHPALKRGVQKLVGLGCHADTLLDRARQAREVFYGRKTRP